MVEVVIPVDVGDEGSGEDAGAGLGLPSELQVLGAGGIEQCILVAALIWARTQVCVNIIVGYYDAMVKSR